MHRGTLPTGSRPCGCIWVSRPGHGGVGERGRGAEPAVREARIGTTYLAENDFESARKHYRLALEAKPDLFEPLYCLAVLEADAGDAPAAFELAKKAVASAPNEIALGGPFDGDDWRG